MLRRPATQALFTRMLAKTTHNRPGAPKPPVVAEVIANRAALGSWIWETPVVRWPGSGPQGPKDLWLKLEAFQSTGSFKARGAMTVMHRLSPEERAHGVVTVSSGNHGIAVASGGRELRCPVRIYMARSSDPYRIERARELGAEVILLTDHQEAFSAARSDVATEGWSFVHPFDGPWTTLGTASLAIELHAQLPASVTTFVVAIGGGSLASGLAPTIKALRPKSRVIGIEPSGAPTLTRSLTAGKPLALEGTHTIADSLAPPFAEPYSFGLVRDFVDEILLVEDSVIRAAMLLLFERLKLALEPAAAAALAGVLAYPERFRGCEMCAMVCGSNIGLQRYQEALLGESEQPWQ
jgi:threonine dehydratase